MADDWRAGRADHGRRQRHQSSVRGALRGEGANVCVADRDGGTAAETAPVEGKGRKAFSLAVDDR
jgi:hypothetical protein